MCAGTLTTPQMRGSRSTKAAHKNDGRLSKSAEGSIPSVTGSRIIMALGALLLAALVPLGFNRFAIARTVPDQAQVIDQRDFLVLETVPPPVEANSTTVCLESLESLEAS